MEKEYDLNELIGGNVDSIVEKFGELSDKHLADLAGLEGKAAKPRSTLTNAIEGEQAARKLTARARELQGAAAAEGVTLHTAAELEALAQQRADEIGQERDGKVATLSDRVEKLEAELQAAKKARTPAKAKAPAKPRRLTLDPVAAGKADRDGAFSVAFTGADDATFEALPDLQFDAGAFEPFAKNNGIVLNQPIDFPEGVSRFEVCKVWLLDGDTPVGVSELISPLPVGGGHRSRIPEKFLRFDGVGGAKKPEPAGAAAS